MSSGHFWYTPQHETETNGTLLCTDSTVQALDNTLDASVTESAYICRVTCSPIHVD